MGYKRGPRVLAATGVWLLIGTTPVSALGQNASSPASLNQPSYTLQVNSRVVLTDVTVTDKQGNPITGLTGNDVRLIDNAKPQKTRLFRGTPAAGIGADGSLGYARPLQQRLPAASPPQVNVLLFDTTTIGIVDQMYLFQQM